jgi:hypothetical protein
MKQVSKENRTEAALFSGTVGLIGIRYKTESKSSPLLSEETCKILSFRDQ